MKFPRFVLLVAMTASACGAAADNDTGSDGAVTEPYVAFERDFSTFRKWSEFQFTNPVAIGQVHLDGERLLYINRLPAKGVIAFPVGTIIVKEIVPTDSAQAHQLFAAVKRGGGYNAMGALGWEWFELAASTGAGYRIVWRGTGPPNGEAYGGVKSGTCNDCHGAAAANDFVLSPPLDLGHVSGDAAP